MRIKRLTLAAFDAASLFTIATVFALVCPAAYAHAYVDPSVMTYTIQALAGVAVALSAVMGVMWRRARRLLFKLLKIDENYGKTVEGRVSRVDSSLNPNAAVSSPTNLTTPKKNTARLALSWPKRFGIALCAMAFVMFTYFVVAPYEIVGGNKDSLSFILRDVWLVMLIFAFVVGTLVALAISACKGKAFDILVAIAFGVAFGGFAQALFLNGGLPSADGHAVPWGDYALKMALNSAIWIAIIAGCVAMAVKMPSLGRVCSVFFALVFMAAQTIGIAHYVKNEIIFPDDMLVSKQGLFEVSSKSNVIVLLVDTVDTQEFEKVLADYPDVMDEFTGFTYFKNSAGAMIPTSHAVPFLLTGEGLQEDESYTDYIDSRYTRATFIPDIADLGYTISLYADCIYGGKSLYSDMTENIHQSEQRDIDILGTISILSKVSLYRDAPWIAKPAFWYYTDDMNQNVLESDGEVSDYDASYILDDAAYYQELQSRGLTIHDEEGSTGAFKFIHLSGSHVPFTLDENAQVVEGGTDMERQTRGTFTILQQYLQDLKDLGVYDNSTIIISADHGYWYPSMDEITAPASPICLVKPSVENGGDNEPLRTSTAPVSQYDFHSTVIDAMGGDGSKYGDGLTYFQISDPTRVRYYEALKYDGVSNSEISQWKIDGDVLDFSNWTLTGKTWSCDDN